MKLEGNHKVVSRKSCIELWCSGAVIKVVFFFVVALFGGRCMISNSWCG
jgi:hypothetical protein